MKKSTAFDEDYRVVLPRYIEALWISYAENQVYYLYEELPYDEIERLFAEGYDFYEDKNATGLYIEKPDVPLTEQQWAEKQILVKGGKRVAALQNDNLKVTIETKSGEVLDCSFTVPELKEIEDYVFRINADTPELRIAVEDCLNELQAAYPNMNFSAIFGG